MGEGQKLAECISSKIKELRASYGWSQNELARKSGITAAALSQIEKGNRVPTLVVTRKIAATLEISLEELIGETSQPVPNKSEVFFRKNQGALESLDEKDMEFVEELIKKFSDR